MKRAGVNRERREDDREGGRKMFSEGGGALLFSGNVLHFIVFVLVQKNES